MNAAMSTMNMNINMNARVRGSTTNPAVSGGGGGGGGDRDFCCFVWDIEHQSGSSGGSVSAGGGGGGGKKGTNASPLFKLSHNAGVASLAWLLEGGQTLAVGGQQRNIQLYDLRVSGTSNATPPISAYGHNFGIHGIEADPFRPHQFATFCRAVAEPVKIWDARRMDSVVSEIKVGTMMPTSSSASPGPDANAFVTSLRWSARETGMLSVAMGDIVLDYDTSSRPVLTRVNRAKGDILDVALYPGTFPADDLDTAPAQVVGTGKTPRARARSSDAQLISELYPQRMLCVLGDRQVHDVAKHTIAPLAVSRRDGRVVHALGKKLFLGSTRSGPSSMESLHVRPDEDISATMMRRARCLHAARYSMDTVANIQVLAEESPLNRMSPERDALLRTWTWIDRIEALCSSVGNAVNPEEIVALGEAGSFWANKGLEEAGVWTLLAMGENQARIHPDTVVASESLACHLYDSPVRR